MTNLPVKAHASLGASSSDRWMNCPGSLAISEGLPDPDTIHKRTGTAAHAVCELALKAGTVASFYLGQTVEGIEVDDQMVESVQSYLDAVRSRLGPSTVLWIERPFNLASLNPPGEMFGTADAVVLDRASGTLDVIDFKYGQGHVVEAKGNPQLRYYGLGAALSVEEQYGAGVVKSVRMTIVQPRAEHRDGRIRSEEIPFIELVEWAGELLAAARATTAPDAPRQPGPWCRFCRAKAICPEKLTEAQQIAMTEFSRVNTLPAPPAPATLPMEVLVDVLGKLDILEDWIRDCRVYAQQRLERGEPVPGYKLVQKRATRKWVNERETQDYLKSKGYLPEEYLDSSLKSPAQVEKLIGKKNLPTDLTKKESSGFTMAPESDAREAVALGAQHEFTALPTESKGND